MLLLVDTILHYSNSPLWKTKTLSEQEKILDMSKLICKNLIAYSANAPLWGRQESNKQERELFNQVVLSELLGMPVTRSEFITVIPRSYFAVKKNLIEKKKWYKKLLSEVRKQIKATKNSSLRYTLEHRAKEYKNAIIQLEMKTC